MKCVTVTNKINQSEFGTWALLQDRLCWLQLKKILDEVVILRYSLILEISGGILKFWVC